MINVILSHVVGDFAGWKKGFDDGEAFRSANGVKTIGVYQAVDNPNSITVITEFPSIEAVNGFMNNPQLQADMAKAGVVGKPEVKILKKF
ncbi:MAG: antibiotic biosynthesis monooxygenase [Bacteroidetes bacterium]|nr:antibiotic biosynthesis monooxygenase [Bacteroidota bacterium]